MVLDPPKGYVRAKESTVCGVGACKTLVQASHKFCPSWGQGTAAKRPRRDLAEAPVATPYSWRLTRVPSGLPCDEPARLRWKELLGLSVAREAFPLWWHLWHPSAAPSWVSWLELTLGFVLALGRLPPPFDRRQQRWLGQSDLAHRPDVDTTVSAVVASFRGLLDPLLSSLNWPPARGQLNKNYSEIADSVAKGGRAQGFKRESTPLVDMQDALDFSPKRRLCTTAVWGDMVQKTRQTAANRARQAEEAAPATPAPATPAVAAPTSPAAPARLKPACSTPKAGVEEPAPRAGEPASSSNEYDLDNPTHCESYILDHFQAHRHDEVRPVAVFFVQSLQSEAKAKKDTLAGLMQKRIVLSKILSKRKDAMHGWLRTSTIEAFGMCRSPISQNHESVHAQKKRCAVREGIRTRTEQVNATQSNAWGIKPVMW